MGRFLLAAHPATQHTNALLSIGQVLRERGHEVAFLAFRDTRALIQAQGFQTLDSIVATEAGRDGGPAVFRPLWQRRRWNSVSTWDPSTSSSRSRRRQASPPACNASGAPATRSVRPAPVCYFRNIVATCWLARP